MVIFKSLCVNHILWNSEMKENFMCACLIKGDVSHLTGKGSRKILVRRSWNSSYIGLAQTYKFGPWMEEAYRLPRTLVSARARDKEKFVHKAKSDSLISKKFVGELRLQDKNFYKDPSIRNGEESDFDETFRYCNQPVEEPWLFQPLSSLDHFEDTDASSGLSDELDILEFIKDDLMQPRNTNEATIDPVSHSEGEGTIGPLDSKDFELQKSISDRCYPIEEPWLFQPYFLVNGPGKKEPAKNEAMDLQSHEQNLQIPGKALSEEDRKEYVRMDTSNLEDQHLFQAVIERMSLREESGVSLKTPISTVILINSSRSTMQRIAVLEDDKLVELLLEPVKDNVQCDSVYLGVVKTLVPGMKGALVHIGGPKYSLMDIKSDSEPFIFPPFHCPIKQRGSDGPFLGDPVVNDIDHGSLDVEALDEVIDDSVEYIQDDFVEIEDEFDVSEVNKDNMNGSVVGSELEVDLKHQGKKHSKDAHTDVNTWAQVQRGTKIVVQVVKEGIGAKSPRLTAFPKLRSRFWVLHTRGDIVGVSQKISGLERKRLNSIAKVLKPDGFGLIVRTVAAGHSIEEMRKDLKGLLSTWKVIMESAKSAALASDEGVKGAVPVLLHQAMGQTLSVVQDYFNSKVKRMVVDSPRTYHEITNYLQEMDPELCDRLELYNKRTPLFDEYHIEEEVNNMLGKRVELSNGGYLIIEQTEALVSIDVNGGHCMLGQGTTQEKAVFDVNLAAAKQIARELRLRDIGGLIVVDFIDMHDKASKRLVYDEMKEAVGRDRSLVNVSELSKNGLMEITRKRVRPSVTFMISEPCSSCYATGRVEALETTFSKIERDICRMLAKMDLIPNPGNPKSWPKFILQVDQHMSNYLTSGKQQRLALLSSSLKVWVLLKVARGFTRGRFELKLFGDSEDNKKFEETKEVCNGGLPTRRSKLSNAKFTIFSVKKQERSKIKHNGQVPTLTERKDNNNKTNHVSAVQTKQPKEGMSRPKKNKLPNAEVNNFPSKKREKQKTKLYEQVPNLSNKEDNKKSSNHVSSVQTKEANKEEQGLGQPKLPKAKLNMSQRKRRRRRRKEQVPNPS